LEQTKGENMKKVAIPVLAALVACPAMAGQYHNNESFWDSLNPYMALRVGAGYTNLNYRYNGFKESFSDEEMHGRVALGLAMWCNKARTEVEWSLFTKIKDNDMFGTDNVNINTKMQNLLMNFYMDLGDYQMIRPFIGAGAGVAFADSSREVAGVIEDHDMTRFSAMGTVGVTFDWRVFAVDMAFRYTYADVDSGIHNFGGDIGIRYMF
jgi:opacity protein-like surface antigen